MGLTGASKEKKSDPGQERYEGRNYPTTMARRVRLIFVRQKKRKWDPPCWPMSLQNYAVKFTSNRILRYAKKRNWVHFEVELAVHDGRAAGPVAHSDDKKYPVYPPQLVIRICPSPLASVSNLLRITHLHV